MGAYALETGRLAVVAESLEISGLHFGYKYGGFRNVGRFEEQLSDNHVGLITWPGGTLSEKDEGRYGFQFDGLFNPALKRPGLAEMFDLARDTGAGLSVVLPTARYEGDDAGLRADVRAFMGKVLSGHYGALPHHLQFEVGNEWYFAFGGSGADARAYGHIADIYVEEIAGALNDPAINRIGAEVGIAVQCGRSVAEDALIRAAFDADTLAEVDSVIHHRFAFQAEGVDRAVDRVGAILDAWEADATAAGGERPELFLGAYNVASLTRDEALSAYVRAQAALGITVRPADVDLAGRSDAAFETFWQGALGKRDYGAEHPRVLLEMFAEYGGEGMGSAGTYGSDMEHAGRLTTQDAQGNAVDFVGIDMLDMLAESTVGTRLLQVSLTNDRRDDVWVYGFENDDKLVVFLSADDVPPGETTVKIAGLGRTYKSVHADSLTARVPSDWMARFGVTDNALVDESNEGQTYAIGHREALMPVVGDGTISVRLDRPHEMVRLSFAKTDAGSYEIAGYAEGAGLVLSGPRVWRSDDASDDYGDDYGDDYSVDAAYNADAAAVDGPAVASAGVSLMAAMAVQDMPYADVSAEPDAAVADDPPPHAGDAAAGDGFDLAAGGLIFALLPLLLLL